VRTPSDGAYSLTVFFGGNARLLVDGVSAGTFTPSDSPRDKLPTVPIGSGVHRVHVQFTLPDNRTAARAGVEQRPAAAGDSARSALAALDVAARVARPRLPDAADDRPRVALVGTAVWLVARR
jgi:hypothetical protein